MRNFDALPVLEIRASREEVNLAEAHTVLRTETGPICLFVLIDHRFLQCALPPNTPKCLAPRVNRRNLIF